MSVDSATMGFQINDVMMQDNIYILLDCLSDSYEINKLLAYDMLLATPSELLPFQVCFKPIKWTSDPHANILKLHNTKMMKNS